MPEKTNDPNFPNGYDLAKFALSQPVINLLRGSIVSMNWRYAKICVLTEISCEIVLAKEFLQVWFPNIPATDAQAQLSDEEEKNIQSQLFSLFFVKFDDVYQVLLSHSFWKGGFIVLPWLVIFLYKKVLFGGIAGLCLRCYVSYPISRACETLTHQFGASYGVEYDEISSIVLTDYAQSLIFVDKNTQTLFQLNCDYSIEKISYVYFTLEVLNNYDPNRQGLENWAYFMTRRAPELKNYLHQAYGLILQTPWAILNRASSKQLQQLSEEKRCLVQAFHDVYRRDRRKRGCRGRCQDPSPEQLLEMSSLLKTRIGIVITVESLPEELKGIADSLRKPEVVTEPAPPASLTSSAELEQGWDLQDFLHSHLKTLLDNAIAQEIFRRITKLEESSRYHQWVSSFIPAYRLLYFEGMSLGQIANEIGMTGQPQASRVLNPTDLLESVHFKVLDQVSLFIGKVSDQLDDNKLFNDHNILMKTIERVEKCLSEDFFEDAYRELKAGKNRQMNSYYAERIRWYLDNC